VDLASEELAGFPYLAPDFSFTEREPGTAPWLKDIHCFNHAATLSLGKISGDIPAVSDGAALLARAIAAAFYREDVERPYQDVVAYQRPELLGDEWSDAEAISE
jgi:cation diffusion facilitator CzcD-associated flavoprotein CzcO